MDGSTSLPSALGATAPLGALADSKTDTAVALGIVGPVCLVQGGGHCSTGSRCRFEAALFDPSVAAGA